MMTSQTKTTFIDFLNDNYQEAVAKTAPGDVLRLNRALGNRVWDKALSQEFTRANSDHSLTMGTPDDVLIEKLTPAVKNAQKTYLMVNNELTGRFH